MTFFAAASRALQFITLLILPADGDRHGKGQTPAPERGKRLQAVSALGMAQDLEKLPALLVAQKTEKDGAVLRAYREAVALIQLKADDPADRIAAVLELKALNSIASRDFLKQLI